MRLAVVLCVMCVSVGGCRTKSLFDDTLPRHQFEDYDAARSGPTPAAEPNEFGEMEPNLRKRLGGR